MADNPLISSLQNPLIKHLVKLRHNHDYRDEHHAFLLEGIKPIAEAMPFISKIFYSESFHFSTLKVKEKWFVTDAVMKKISGMTSPEGVVAEVKMPMLSIPKNAKFLLALDGINDPGNLGTLLRSALALGWEGVFILPTSCDPYNEKAIRAARGAHFRLPIVRCTEEELKNYSEKMKLQLLIADLKGVSPSKIPANKGKILVLGNEAHGASPELKETCTKVTIPMKGEMESLNVAIAGGILMYLLKME